MPATTAPTARTNLVALLKARAGLAGVTVTRGGPTKEEEVKREHIWLGRVRGTQEWAQTGGSGAKRQEDYLLQVTVRVIREGDDEDATEARCWALFAEVESQLRESHTINGALTQGWCELGSFEQDNRPLDDNSWLSQVDAEVRCVARI